MTFVLERLGAEEGTTRNLLFRRAGRLFPRFLLVHLLITMLEELPKTFSLVGTEADTIKRFRERDLRQDELWTP